MAKSHDRTQTGGRNTRIERSLRWHGPHGHRFALDVTGYQFPEIEEGHDANWLTIRIEARNEEGSWERRVSCVLTWELPWIARWLSYVADGAMEVESCSGLENDLAFRFIAASELESRFAIVLRAGLCRDADAGGFSVVNVALNAEELSAAADYFEWAFEAFPPRGRQGKLGLAMPGPRLLRGE